MDLRVPILSCLLSLSPMAAKLSDSLTINHHQFQIEVARTPEQLKKGLMFRTQVPELTGMLFEYDKPSEVALWMHNTFVSLDMLFLDQAGRITCIHSNTVPFSRKHLTCPHKIRAALEIKGGEAKRLGIKVGDYAAYRLFNYEFK